MQVAQRQASPSQNMVAPVTGNANKSLMRAEIKQGIREVVVCKDGQGMLGVRVRHVNNVSLFHSLLPFLKMILVLYLFCYLLHPHLCLFLFFCFCVFFSFFQFLTPTPLPLPDYKKQIELYY